MVEKKNPNERVRIQHRVWCKIRYCQHCKGITNEQLAQFLEVNERTLKEYDKDAKNVTLGKIDKFLSVIGMTIDDLLTMK